MTQPRIYIAGPMRGYTDLNFPAFDRARDNLKQWGWDPVSPADIDRANGMDHTVAAEELSDELLAAIRQRDIAAIETCDALCTLPGWGDSLGAKAELNYALWKGIPVFAYTTADKLGVFDARGPVPETWYDEWEKQQERLAFLAVSSDQPRRAAGIATEENIEELLKLDLTGAIDHEKLRKRIETDHTCAIEYDPDSEIGQYIRTKVTLATDSKERKDAPIYSGNLAYFPLAHEAIARLSKAGNDKHNPGEPLHWSRGKSCDHADCLIRHQLEVDQYDPDDGILHAVKVAWRALAQLQVLLESGKGWKQ